MHDPTILPPRLTDLAASARHAVNDHNVLQAMAVCEELAIHWSKVGDLEVLELWAWCPRCRLLVLPETHPERCPGAVHQLLIGAPVGGG